ncbi:MAG: ABC transporter substrate-binding protein [Promethearchaeota archaeon]
MEKKNIAIIVLIVALLGSGIGNIMLVVFQPDAPPAERLAYVRSTGSGPATLEITDSWDSASNDVLEQVVETLFFYDLSDPDLPRINLLAKGYWWNGTTELHIELRQGILFHDGTDFDADAAKWNLDRLQYMINATGNNVDEVVHTSILWMFPDGTTPIMKTIVSDGLYNLTITLNGAYATFLNVLTYINSGMLSPTAHAGDIHTFLDLTTGKPIGTGPFSYDYLTPNVECRLQRFDHYWRGPANFPTVIFAIYSDAVTAHNAYLGYTLDSNDMASDQDLLLYDSDPKIDVLRLTTPSLVYQYLGFNNKKYNKTWRAAMSWAVNYTYVIDVMRLGNAYRAVGAISPGYGAAYNASVAALAPVHNVTKAREIMQSMGFGTTFTTDAEWVAVAEGSSPFLSVPNHYNTGNSFREDMFVALTTWFKQIGIEVTDEGVTWAEFLGFLFDDYDALGVFAIGWAPDYLDPFNMLDPLFNPISSSNSGQVNDTWLNDKMLSVLSETDDNARNDIYKSIQWYMATQGFFHMPLYHGKVTSNHLANIYGVQPSAFGALRIYPMYRAAYP